MKNLGRALQLTLALLALIPVMPAAGAETAAPVVSAQLVACARPQSTARVVGAAPWRWPVVFAAPVNLEARRSACRESDRTYLKHCALLR